MKKLLLAALTVALVLPALPGAAQVPGLPTELPGLPGLPGASESPTPTPTPTPTATGVPVGDPVLTYAGRGATSALSLTIAGQGLATGVTATRVANAETEDCAGVACATAAGLAPPAGEAATATSPGNPGPNTVQTFDLGEDGNEALEQILTLTVGAATAETAETPSASSTANGITLDVTLTQTILGQLPADALAPLTEGLGTITDALSPLVDADPTGTLGGLTDTLEGLLGDLTSSPLIRIQAGESTAASTFGTGTVSASSQAAGAIITILPTPESTPLLPEGLAIIEVTPSMTSASANGTDRATAEATGSVVRITLLPGVLEGLPGLDPGLIDQLPLGDILDLLPEEVTDLLPIDDLLGGLLGGAEEEGSEAPTEGEGEGEEGGESPLAPIEDLIGGGFMQADDDSGGFVIDLETGTEQTCILEGLPIETCITVGGTSENFTADGLGVGVLAAGVDISALRGLDSFGGIPGFTQTAEAGLIELSLGRSESGVAAQFVQATATPTPTPTPTQQTGLPNTGTNATLVVPALGLMALSGLALVGLRRRRDV